MGLRQAIGIVVQLLERSRHEAARKTANPGDEYSHLGKPTACTLLRVTIAALRSQPRVPLHQVRLIPVSDIVGGLLPPRKYERDIRR